MRSMIVRGMICTAMLIGLPLVGLISRGASLAPYLEFPPLTRYVRHAPFDWRAFIAIAILDLAMLAVIARLLRMGRTASRRSPAPLPRPMAFPWWGMAGILIMGGGWLLAWTRFEWFQTFQAHTFCLPWIGYILVINAACHRRSGHCLMTQQPLRFVLLWPASALFWWFFEYLNRFVQNWYYVGVERFSAPEYALHASLAFATVLPAVLSTQQLLLTYPRLNQGLASVAPLPLPDGKRAAGLVLLASAAGLALIGPFSDYLYPLVWAAPLLVITSLQALWDRPTLFSGLRYGDWRSVITAALAALICGFFWELWNFKSLARWEYAVPMVDRWRIFAMPLLGYGGYLPFGLECLLVGQWVLQPPDMVRSRRRTRRQW